MIEIKEEFKYRLDTALAAANMKPIDLANRTGISESTISQYRSGYSKPKDTRLVKIANALGVNPSWLMGLDVPMNITDVEKSPDDPKITRALDFIDRFDKASPEIKAAIETLLTPTKKEG